MSDMKTHIDKLRNPNYLGSWDLMDVDGNLIEKTVTIKEVKSESVFDQKSNGLTDVLTVHFNECKPIILNSTNRKVLKKVTGTSFIEEMAGERITLTTKKIKAFGELVDAIRIKTQTNEVLKPELVPDSAGEDKVVKFLVDGGDIAKVTTKYLIKDMARLTAIVKAKVDAIKTEAINPPIEKENEQPKTEKDA